MNRTIDITEAIRLLQVKRKCFVSEADFQLELAWILKEMYPDALVRCEYTPEFNPDMHIDILVIKDGKWFPIELKYKTRKSRFVCEGETFVLKEHSAKDVNCYLYLKDIERIESVKKHVVDSFGEGYTVMITNDLSYARKPAKDDCIYAAFSLHEGQTKTGTLDWKETAGPGTKRGCEQPIVLEGIYECHWNEYSVVEESGTGRFIYLTNKIEQ